MTGLMTPGRSVNGGGVPVAAAAGLAADEPSKRMRATLPSFRSLNALKRETSL
jgi:hypothetical protein